MKKSTRIVKRALALFLVVLMSINTFAAVVGDNDGAAFITKAEFDSLKNDFQSQLDRYNSSIDDKIDGAIAAYLSGISVAKVSTENIFFRNWNSVTSTNYVFENKFQPLDFIGMYENKKWVTNTSPSSYWRGAYWVYANMHLGRSTGTTQRLNCVDAGIEGSAITKDFVLWKGYSIDYKDTLTISLSNVLQKSGTSYVVDWNYNSGGAYFFCYMGGLTAVGYMSDPNSYGDNVWVPRIYSTAAYTAGYQSLPSTVMETLGTSITLGTDASGATYEYEHVIHYGNLNNIHCADPDWINTLNNSGKVVGSNFVKIKTAGQWAGMCGADAHNVNEMTSIRNFSNYYLGGYGSDTMDTNIPTVGLINKSFSSSDLYQFDELMSLTIGGANYSVNPLSLCQGFCLLGAENDAKITWKPRFTNLFDDSKAAIDTKINIQFSTKPFCGTTTSSDAIVKVSVNGSALTDIATVEADNDLNIEWTMPQSGFIYITWWPEDATIKSANWSIDLDLANCNTYKKELAL